MAIPVPIPDAAVPSQHLLHGNQDLRQLLGLISQLLRVADPDPVSLPALDGLGDLHTPDGRGDDHVGVSDVHPVAGSGIPVDLDVQVPAPQRAFGER